MNPIERSKVFGEVEGTVERIAPGHFGARFEREHIGRYRWASRHVEDLAILDVACGTGYGTAVLTSAGPRSVTSVDLSFEALAFGKPEFGMRAICSNGERLPFRDATFDAIVSLETVEHVPHPDQLLSEFHRVLKADGLLVLSTPNAALSEGTNPYHLKEFELDELVAVLRASSFEPVTILGQLWRLRGRAFERVPGLRRLAWEIQGRARPVRAVPFAAPLQLCVVARARSAA